jgi:hypothetical protein
MWPTGIVNGVDGFPVPPHPIPIIVGVNSVELACLAAVETDGINIRSNHPRFEEIIDAARAARPPELGPLLVTAWAALTDELQDAGSEQRQRFERIGVDRLVLVQFDRADPARIRAVRH